MPSAYQSGRPRNRVGKRRQPCYFIFLLAYRADTKSAWMLARQARLLADGLASHARYGGNNRPAVSSDDANIEAVANEGHGGFGVPATECPAPNTAHRRKPGGGRRASCCN